MPHPPALIQSILDQVRESYSTPEYRFEIERPLFLRDRSMQPDIQVFGPDDQLLCAVEIGYTRPEKLKHYRRIGIPDVRWYSKAGELVDDYVETERKIEIITRELQYNGSPWYKVYFDTDDRAVMCAAANAAIWDYEESRSRTTARRAIRIAAEHWVDPDDIRHAMKRWDLDTARDHSHFWDCEGAFFSNGAATFAIARCDVCDHTSVVYSSSLFDALFVNPPGHNRAQYDALANFDNYLKYCDRQGSAIEPIPFNDIIRHVGEEFNQRLTLEELEPAQWYG